VDVPAELPVVAAAFLAAGAVQGSLGFGFGLVGLVGAATVLPVSFAVPLVACIALWVYIGHLGLLRKSFNKNDAAPMVAGMLLGVPFGVLLLRFGEPTWLLGALGVVLLAGTFAQLRGATPVERGPRTGFAAGAAGGVLAGALGTGGPPLVLYVSSQPWSPSRGTACLVACFGAAAVAQLIGYTVSGLFGWEQIVLAALGAPAAVVGLLLGQSVFKRLPEAGFRAVVQAVLACVGGWYVFRAVF
jgi:uncharacterized protein